MPERRRRLLAPYQVDAALMARREPDALFMHCLPAHRGEEVAADGDRRPALGGIRPGGEPPARAKGHPRLVSRLRVRRSERMSASLIADNLLRPFQLERSALRGRVVRLGALVDRVLTRHDYPEPVEPAARRAVRARRDARRRAQVQGHLQPADAQRRPGVADDRRLHQRGRHARLCQVRRGAPWPQLQAATCSDLLGHGHLAFTVDQSAGAARPIRASSS